MNAPYDYENTTEAGTPPARRIPDAQTALTIYKEFYDASLTQQKRRNRIQGLVDGNVPFSTAQRKRMGQNSGVNVNFREAEAAIDKNKDALWRLVNGGVTLVEATCHTSIENGAEYCDVVEEEYTASIREWPKFPYVTQICMKQLLLFGYSAQYWRDKFDWRCDVAKNRSILVGPKTKACVDDWNEFALRDAITANEMYDFIEQPSAVDLGWNVPYCRNVLIGLYNKGLNTAEIGYSDWEEYQERRKAYDENMFKRGQEDMKIGHMLVKESSGKWSHYILFEGDAPEKAKYLYEKDEAYDSLPQFFIPFFYDYGDGEVRSIKGLGHRIFPHFTLSNKYLCDLFNAARIASSLVLQPKDASDAQKLEFMRADAFTVLPPNLQAMNAAFSPQLSPLISVRAMSSAIMDNNTGQSRPVSENPLQTDGYKSAQQLAFTESKLASFSMSRIEMFYTSFDMWHKEVFRRMTDKDYINSSIDRPGKEEAVDFVLRCVARGVPMDLLLGGGFKIKSYRAIGIGSMQSALSITNETLKVSGSFTSPKGRENAVKQWIEVRHGPHNVRKFMGPSSTERTISDAESHAMLENNDFVDGKYVEPGAGQPHMLHVNMHMSMLAQTAQQWKQGQAQMDSVRAKTMYETTRKHLVHHFNLMNSDITHRENLPRLIENLKVLDKIYAKIIEQANAIMAQRRAKAEEERRLVDEAKAQKMSQENQIKREKNTQDNMIKLEKTQSLNTERAKKTNVASNLKEEAMRRTQEREDRKAEAEIRREDAKAAAKRS